MRKTFISGLILLSVFNLHAYAQSDTDRFGRDKEDKITSGGLLVSYDLSGFNIRGIDGFRSLPGSGVTMGGFIDFKVTPSFVIQSELLFNRETKYLQSGANDGVMNSDGLSFGFSFLRKKQLEGNRGIIYMGGGPYSEFTLFCKTNLDGETFNPYNMVIDTDTTGKEIFALSNHDAGLKLKAVYEFPFHMQIFMSGSYSISDILSFNHGNEMSLRPYRMSAGVAWRFR